MPTGFITTIEGCEGAGKTTVALRIRETLTAQCIPLFAQREPGGTEVGESIRGILLGVGDPLDARTELFLMLASRAQLYQQEVSQALAANRPVLIDRSGDSSFAYQGFGRFEGDKDILAFIEKANAFAYGGFAITRTYLLDMEPEIGLERITRRSYKLNRIDKEELPFHKKVRAGFHEAAKRNPERFRVVDANRTLEEIYTDILLDYSGLLREKGFTP